MVYGRTADGDLDETAPRRRFGNAYSDSKLAAERLALREARAGRVPVVVLQPTAVYGPFGGVWTAQVLATLRAGRVILVDGGLGLCNAVYVDDLVDAMLAAATGDGVVGEAFLVSDGEPVPWRDFYGCFERMLGERRTVAMSADEARAHYRRARRRVPALLPELLATVRRDEGARDRLLATRELLALRELASAVLPEALQQRIKSRLLRGGATPGAGPGDAARAAAGEDPIHPLTPQMIGFYRTRTRVRIGKARRVLGWSPAHTLAAGMAKTEAWARWADLLGR
jgi:nucleoside-diphosphate-sugar epimerase